MVGLSLLWRRNTQQGNVCELVGKHLRTRTIPTGGLWNTPEPLRGYVQTPLGVAPGLDSPGRLSEQLRRCGHRKKGGSSETLSRRTGNEYQPRHSTRSIRSTTWTYNIACLRGGQAIDHHPSAQRTRRCVQP